MPRPESLVGPVRATVEDIEALNRLFAEAFTDRYHRDGLTGVRVPHLNRDVWRYAIADAGEGAMMWHSTSGELAAFNLVHRAGIEGWMGPLCVLPALQGGGFGRRIVEAGFELLRRSGARIIGLETMPRTVDNIGFYSRLGFVPGHLTITVVKDLPGTVERVQGAELLSASGVHHAVRLAECAALTGQVAPGLDFTRAVELTEELGLGDTVLVRRGDGLAGFALWHSAPLAQGRPPDEARVLKLVARDVGAFVAVAAAVEHLAPAAAAVARVSVRCQSEFADAYTALIGRDYRVHWTDLRMTLAGAPELVAAPGIVLSNWEI